MMEHKKQHNLIPCKHCGEMISKSAKTCPHCGAKNRKATVGIVVLIILVFIIVVAVFGSEGNGPKKVGDISPASGTEQISEPPEQTDFGVGEQVELNDVVVTLVNVSENNGNGIMKPSDGKVFIVCEFEIENNSEKDISVSSILSFSAYIDDYSTSMNLSAMLSTNKSQLDGSVAAGKKMNGVIGYEADPDWKTIEVRFTPDFWSGKEIIFTASK